MAHLSGLDDDDLYQEGVLGLMHAAEKYDSSRGAFSTYAVHWIRQAVLRALETKGRLIHVPIYRQYGKNRDQLAKEYPATRIPWSLDAALKDNGREPSSAWDAKESLGEQLESQEPTPEEVAERAETALTVDRLMTAAKLDARERYIMLRRYSGGTLKGIGAELGISRERVRQIEGIAMRRLQRAAQNDTR